MDPHPSPKSTTIPLFSYNIAENSPAAQADAASKLNEMVTFERDFTTNTENGLAAGIVTVRSTIPQLHFFSQGLKEEHAGLDVLPSLHAEMLLLQFAGVCAIVQQELSMIRQKFAELTI